jgi:predicted GTPase
MLRLKGDAAPKCRHGPSSTTGEVKVYTSTINGVEVRIIDTPGLAAMDVDEAKVIAKLEEESKGKVDMLLYCVSLLPDSIIDEQDEKIIESCLRICHLATFCSCYDICKYGER